MMSSTANHHRARIAALSRYQGIDSPEVVDAQRELRVTKLEDAVRRVVETSPPPTAEQRVRLAQLLFGCADRV